MYYCQFCNYKTKSRSKIQSHHIIPKESFGTNHRKNRVFCCPTCHLHIFIPANNINKITGMHSIESDEKSTIIIYGWKLSTAGRLLHYMINNEEIFAKDKNYGQNCRDI